MKFIYQIICCYILMFSCQDNAMKNWELVSADGKIKIKLSLDEHQLFYTASIKKESEFIEVILKSPLGIIRDDADFTKNLSFVKSSDIRTIDEQYDVITGKALKLHNQANELLVSFTNPDGYLLDVALRTYDDGVAFQYIFPEEKTGQFIVSGESTGFKFSEGLAWIQPYADVTKWTPAYESYFENEISIGESSPKPNGWCFPALFHTADSWVLLSEAGLDGDFYGAHLNPEVHDSLYTIRLAEKNEARNVFAQEAVSELMPWASPWRVAIIGNDLQTIVASNIIRHLSPSNRIDETSWIKPGRASWSWLSDHDSPQDYKKLKSFVDLAVEMGWEYSLVDANWNLMQGGDIRQLVDYANSKGIGILMWYNSGGPHNEVTGQVRDIMHLADKRRAEFAKLHVWGVKGVKIDFFQSDKPGMMKLYKDILEDAAAHQIMVNFHGCTIPRGWSRTYPHMMSMESVRGAECYTFASEYPQYAPAQNTILPVTRNVIGPMDYTPVIFSDMKYPHITSYGHELALSVLFETGWLHLSDAVESYNSLPDAPKIFLKNVPVVWDETNYITGWPGKEMVLARRNGNTWYVAGINGENKVKKLPIQLPFLSEGEHEAKLITDGEIPRSFSDRAVTVNNDDPVELSMIRYGGFVLKIEIE
jgi:alpha-glucosidase